METIESIYANMFREYDDIQAARGCNQYKHVSGCPDAGGENGNMTIEQKVDFLHNAECEIVSENGSVSDYKIDMDMAQSLVDGDVQGTWYKAGNGAFFVFEETEDTLMFKNDKDAQTARSLFMKQSTSTPKIKTTQTKPETIHKASSSPAPKQQQKAIDVLQNVNNALKTKGRRALYDKDLLNQLKQISNVRFMK